MKSSKVMHYLWMVLLLPLGLCAYQKDIQFQNLSEGLSQQTVTCIIQESTGYMWLGTLNGLNRYDGIGFKIFEYNPLDSTSLSHNRIFKIAEDHHGNIWIATSNGLNRYHRETEGFIRYYYEKDNVRSLSANLVQDVFVDSRGLVWVIAGDLCLYNSDTEDFTRFTTNGNVNFIYEDRQGLLWTNYDDRLYVFDHETQTFILPDYLKSLTLDATTMVQDGQGYYWFGINNRGLLRSRLEQDSPHLDQFSDIFKSKENISDYIILALYLDSKEQLWVSCENGGLFVFDRQRELRYRFLHKPGEINSISFNSIWSVYEDRIGRMWLGTWNAGVDVIDPYIRKFIQYQFEKGENSLTHNQVTNFAEDDQGNLWIAMDGGGIDYFDRKRQSFVSHKHDPKDPNSLSGNAVLCLCHDDDGNLWAGTWAGGINVLKNHKQGFIHYNDQNSILVNNNIFTILNGGDGNIFMGLWQGGLCIHNTQTNRWESYRHNPSDEKSISSDGLFSLYRDQRGSIWVGTESGLNLFKRDQHGSGYFVHYILDDTDASITSMCEDPKNNFWVGTQNGLFLLNRDDETYKAYRKEQGLPNNEILAIQSDDDQRLWISTNNGLSCFDTEKETFRNYDTKDGLQSFQFIRNASYRTKSGEMFFGGVKGFNVFHPESVRDNPFVPSVALTDFKLFNKSLPIGGDSPLKKSIGVTEEITLAYNQTVFSIEFVALNFTHPEKNQHAYMLEGFEEDWNYSGKQRNATYTNLDPGEYIFRVKAANNDGIWNEEGASLKITITPPFWVTWWFRTLALLLIIGSAYLWYYQRMSRVRRLNQELEEKVHKRTQALQERTDQLNQKTSALETAKKETDDILHTVGEGLFLLTRDFQLGSQYAFILEKIFEKEDLGHVDFLSLLNEGIDKEKHATIKRYLGLLFKEDIDEQTLDSLNPLAHIEMYFDASRRSKHLAFEFRRIYNKEGVISELMATVRDMTEQVLLEQKLVESEKRTNRQLNWMLSILHVEPEMLQDFIESVQREVDFIEGILDLQHGKDNFNLRLEKIYRSMHLIKGNASLLALKFFAAQAHQFEDIISDIQKKDRISAEDFNSLKNNLKEIRDSINDVHGLLDRIYKLNTQMRPKRDFEQKLLIQSFVNLTNHMAEDLGKITQLKYDRFKVNDIPHKNQLLVKEVLIQMIRNALAHGIEAPDLRKAVGKSPKATIEISTSLEKDVFVVKIRDDGRGLQIDQLRKRAKESGKWPKNEIDGWTKEQVINTIFMPGISTSENINQISGRGVGMDLVKEKIETHKGSIETVFEEGKYCEFKVILPIKGK
jgi:ligand-binding sensor domain-containing protein/signal transduction histidine kinase